MSEAPVRRVACPCAGVWWLCVRGVRSRDRRVASCNWGERAARARPFPPDDVPVLGRDTLLPAPGLPRCPFRWPLPVLSPYAWGVNVNFAVTWPFISDAQCESSVDCVGWEGTVVPRQTVHLERDMNLGRSGVTPVSLPEGLYTLFLQPTVP